MIPREGLILDMGDVLCDATIWRRWLLQFLRHFGLQTHYRAFFQVWERDFLFHAWCGRQGYWQAFRCFLQTTGLTHGQIDEIVAASAARLRKFDDELRPLPGVKSTISKLASDGYRVSVLTNSCYSESKLITLLDRMGLADYIECVTSSHDLGHAQPEKACYELAISRLGLDVASVTFIGHDARELRGAMNAGLWTVAVNHEENVEADIYLDQLDQLPEALSHRRQYRAAA